MTFPANVFALANIEKFEPQNSVNDFDTTSILGDLNNSQKEAVQHPGGPLLVVAGAGSGKTRVLTRRIANLISTQHVSPFEILAITFTNKAAAEMVERVSKVVGPVASRMWVSTFHSACARILRMDGSSVGIKPGFSIYDVSDATRLVDYARRDLGADPKRFSAKSLQRTISNFKNELISPAQALERAEMDTHTTVAKIYAEYEHRLRASNAADFDDLLGKCVELLRENEEVREKFQNRFKHVLVDEFQDTNMAQWELVRLISGKHQNITVVGDADQSIYKFRGADHLNMQRFEEEYEDCKVVVLNTNYRSTENILSAANAVISNNTSRHKKELISDKGQGEPIVVYYANSDRSEAQYVASTIAKLMDSTSLDSIAIFYRTNAQSRLIEEQLIRNGISYRIIGGTKFFERREIRDAIAYLKVFSNSSDEASWRRIVNEPKRGLGDTSVAKIASFARSYDVSFRKALERPIEIGLSKKASNAALGLCSLFDLAANGEHKTVAQVLEHLLKTSGYTKVLEDDGSFESQGRLENLLELISQAREFDIAIDKKSEQELKIDVALIDNEFAGDDISIIDPDSVFDRVGAFLEAVSLLAESDQANANDEAVTLMTLHTAKGLEYSTVFITGLEEGLFPHERSMGDVAELEEERRLCYVGITRAMDRLYLTCALSRMMYATPDYFSPSRFLKEIPAELVNAVQDKEAPSDFMQSRSPGSNNKSSRYSKIYDDFAFDDIDPNDQSEQGRVIGQGKNPRRRDFATDEIIRSRIWGDSTTDSVSPTGQFGNSEISSLEVEAPPLETSFDSSPYGVGTRVSHEKYGLGTVTKLDLHNNGDVAISVDFPTDRTRTFMASLNPPIELV